MEEIIRIIMEAVATGVGVLVLILIKKVMKKYGIETDLLNSHVVQSYMEKAVLHWEEEGYKCLKRTGQKMQSWEKEQGVLSDVAKKFPTEKRADLLKRLNAVLVTNKLGATVSAPKLWPEVARKPPENDVKILDEDNGGTD